MEITFSLENLVEIEADAIVNAWNRNIIPWWLLLPQGVSKAIKRSAGTRVFRELGYTPLPLGQARLTSAGRLAHRYKGIVHVAGINMLWRSSASSVRDSVNNALALAESQGWLYIVSDFERNGVVSLREGLGVLSAFPVWVV